MTSFFNAIKKYTHERITQAAANQVVGKSTIVLGLSGGPDSMFLFQVLKDLHNQNHLTLIAAHLDHEWRTASAEDAAFCTGICKAAGITLVVQRASELATAVTYNGSQEEVGRRLRRHFFKHVQQQFQAHFIALAHHRQDQEETFFIRLLRGASLTGLTCMKAIEGCYFRPLLAVDKSDMINYLEKKTIPYLTDPTNQSDTYLRNRIRKYVIPALHTCDQRFTTKLESTIAHLQEEEQFLQNLTAQMYQEIFPTTPDTGNLPAFKKISPVMQRRIILSFLIKNQAGFNPSSGLIEEICRFLMSQDGGHHQIGTQWSVHKKGTTFGIKF